MADSLQHKPRWDIFCQVVDNFGDIGVCWRLARQLAAEHKIQVRLWLDDLGSLHKLHPEADPLRDTQTCRGVEIRHWTKPFPEALPADVVIEAFACELPQNYLTSMARQPRNPVWINLEYLSAETWVEGCHGLPSPHPQLSLTKYFFFPGFTPATGGLLREHGLLEQCEAGQRASAQLRSHFGLPAASSESEALVSLFCYDSAPLTAVLHAWQMSTHPVRCLLPEGLALAEIATFFGRTHIAAGEVLLRGKLTLHILPFLPQEEYDQLLWACDINFVRGEDSFVRAQWAARPLIWHIYPQQESTHMNKLEAFLDRYCTGLEAQAASVLRAFHRGWNTHAALPWDELWQQRIALKTHAQAWRNQLAAESDLAAKLVIFCKIRV